MLRDAIVFAWKPANVDLDELDDEAKKKVVKQMNKMLKIETK